MKDQHTHITDIDQLTENEKLNLSITLGGRSAYGFFRYYFNELPHHPTQTDAFNFVNALYFELFGEYRYECYDTFRKVYTRNLKNNKK